MIDPADLPFVILNLVNDSLPTPIDATTAQQIADAAITLGSGWGVQVEIPGWGIWLITEPGLRLPDRYVADPMDSQERQYDSFKLRSILT
jgi:hypothetical protein